MRTATTFCMSMTYLGMRTMDTSTSIGPSYSRSLILRSRNRYLILDVLGQGTFGQVVKCQNLKTQEVVAVKVVKNRTAYFNQSMMEVSVLDLVRSCLPSQRTKTTDMPFSLMVSSTKTTTIISCGSRTHLSIGSICAWFSSCSA